MTDGERLPAAPAASSAAVRAVMIGNRRRDTAPEMKLRKELHRRGLRYRLHRKVGSGRSAPRPDVLFPVDKIAVFVDGCFWHGCPSHGLQPTTNSDYWGPKIARNRQRDARNTAVLESNGWTVLRIWEHESAS